MVMGPSNPSTELIADKHARTFYWFLSIYSMNVVGAIVVWQDGCGMRMLAFWRSDWRVVMVLYLVFVWCWNNVPRGVLEINESVSWRGLITEDCWPVSVLVAWNLGPVKLGRGLVDSVSWPCCSWSEVWLRVDKKMVQVLFLPVECRWLIFFKMKLACFVNGCLKISCWSLKIEDFEDRIRRR